MRAIVKEMRNEIYFNAGIDVVFLKDDEFALAMIISKS